MRRPVVKEEIVDLMRQRQKQVTGSLKELEDFACGWYIQVGLGALEKHLQKAISASEEDLKIMGLHGRELVENKFTVQAVAQKFLGIYKTLAKHESLHVI